MHRAVTGVRTTKVWTVGPNAGGRESPTLLPPPPPAPLPPPPAPVKEGGQTEHTGSVITSSHPTLADGRQKQQEACMFATLTQTRRPKSSHRGARAGTNHSTRARDGGDREPRRVPTTPAAAPAAAATSTLSPLASTTTLALARGVPSPAAPPPPAPPPPPPPAPAPCPAAPAREGEKRPVTGGSKSTSRPSGPTPGPRRGATGSMARTVGGRAVGTISRW